MDQDIKNLEREFEQDLANAHTDQDVQGLKVKYLGRNSLFNQIFAKIPSLDPKEKGVYGKSLNVLKKKMTDAIEAKSSGSKSQEKNIDMTFCGAQLECGSRHVLTKVTYEICDIFGRMGFGLNQGQEIEDEWHNFTALNFPDDHPSRDSFDTFYLDLPKDPQTGKKLLRCHTSPAQIRVMKNNPLPLAVVSPGRVYRPDQVDATHSFMFHQVEGFAVDTGLTFANLKGVLLNFAQQFFSASSKIRMRPHFFPFTEPSAEVDVTCFVCDGGEKTLDQKCPVCKGKGWIEILGCGMIHPNVLKFCGIDQNKYQGFAFGMGVERMAMLKYAIKDIRLFYENDARFLNQFYEI